VIKGEQKIPLMDFSGGRATPSNPSDEQTDHLLSAVNIFNLGDGSVRRRKGYKKVGTAFAGRVRAMFDFQRQSDGNQFLIVAGNNGEVGLMDVVTGQYTQLAVGIFDAPHSFMNTTSTAYIAAKKGMYKIVNIAGLGNVIRKWGIDAPVAAPGLLITNGGTLDLKYGRQYVVCNVSKWTDAVGSSRFHIGAPSPISAFTGQIDNGVVQLTITPSFDAQVTHQWIFCPPDGEENGSDVFYFCGEVTNGTTLFADTVADDDLDDTRLAPWDNLPPPNGGIVFEYQNRPVVIDVDGASDVVRVGAFEETDLGITYENFPITLQFAVPAGTKKLTCGMSYNQSAMLSTEDFWFQIRGFDSESFTERDKVCKPGAAGKKLAVDADGYLIYLGKDKQLHAWDGVNPSVTVSDSIARKSDLDPTQLAMSDLNSDQLSQCELVWYSFGEYSFAVVRGSTDAQVATGYGDWLQIWDTTAFMKGKKPGLCESDMFPSHFITAMEVVGIGASDYIFLGDKDGNIYRFPDGDLDDTFAINSGFSPLPSMLGTAGKKKFLNVAVLTNRLTAADDFKVSAKCADGINSDRQYTALDLKVIKDASAPIGWLRHSKNTARGVWFQTEVQFPVDDKAASVSGLIVTFEETGAMR
jgi:hypothetical protein